MIHATTATVWGRERTLPELRDDLAAVDASIAAHGESDDRVTLRNALVGGIAELTPAPHSTAALSAALGQMAGLGGHLLRDALRPGKTHYSDDFEGGGFLCGARSAGQEQGIRPNRVGNGAAECARCRKIAAAEV